MKSAREIKMLRCGKGYFTMQEMVDALGREGVKLTKSGYSLKESGKHKFKMNEVVAMAKILGMTLEEAVNFFA